MFSYPSSCSESTARWTANVVWLVSGQGRSATERHTPCSGHPRTDASADWRRGSGLGTCMGHLHPDVLVHQPHHSARSAGTMARVAAGKDLATTFDDHVCWLVFLKIVPISRSRSSIFGLFLFLFLFLFNIITITMMMMMMMIITLIPPPPRWTPTATNIHPGA